jgi:hypothetical protein
LEYFLLNELHPPGYLSKKTLNKEAKMRLKILGALLVFGLLLGVSGITFATNGYKTQFNTRYGTAGSAIDQCILCHAVNSGADIPSTETPPNPYGVALENNGLNFAAIETSDSDGDGFSNLAEITARTFPGNAASRPSGSDTTLPTVNTFTIPATSSSLTVSITAFAATDNVAVTGFMVTESATKPLATAAGWSATAPTSYTAATAGAKTLYAWAKDAAGNVSASRSAPVTVTPGPTTSRNIVDFDGDGKSDMTIYRSSTGGWYVRPSSGVTPYGIAWGGDPSDKPAPGDYDGDGKTDMAVYRTSAGAWYMDPSSGAAPYGVGWGGDPSDEPAPGDYDGDGKTDLAVYRTSTGAWYIRPSGGAAPYGVALGGDPSDKPVPGDYDGDGKDDIAVYRTSTGAWYLRPSSVTTAFGVGWGGDPSDQPAAGDYDGDGKTDLAVYRTGTGAWYVRPSTGAAPYGLSWGGDASDKPVSGDYDGDGKDDFAVFRAATGAWYITPSGGGSPYGVGWGGNTNDVPVILNPSIY